MTSERSSRLGEQDIQMSTTALECQLHQDFCITAVAPLSRTIRGPKEVHNQYLLNNE